MADCDSVKIAAAHPNTSSATLRQTQNTPLSSSKDGSLPDQATKEMVMAVNQIVSVKGGDEVVSNATVMSPACKEQAEVNTESLGTRFTSAAARESCTYVQLASISLQAKNGHALHHHNGKCFSKQGQHCQECKQLLWYSITANIRSLGDKHQTPREIYETLKTLYAVDQDTRVQLLYADYCSVFSTPSSNATEFIGTLNGIEIGLKALDNTVENGSRIDKVFGRLPRQYDCFRQHWIDNAEEILETTLDKFEHHLLPEEKKVGELSDNNQDPSEEVMAVFEWSDAQNTQSFLCDSGATTTIVNDTKFFLQPTFRNDHGFISTASDPKGLEVIGKGQISLRIKNRAGQSYTLVVEEVFYCPTATMNILALSRLALKGLHTHIHKDGCLLVDTRTESEVGFAPWSRSFLALLTADVVENEEPLEPSSSHHWTSESRIDVLVQDRVQKNDLSKAYDKSVSESTSKTGDGETMNIETCSAVHIDDRNGPRDASNGQNVDDLLAKTGEQGIQNSSESNKEISEDTTSYEIVGQVFMVGYDWTPRLDAELLTKLEEGATQQQIANHINALPGVEKKVTYNQIQVRKRNLRLEGRLARSERLQNRWTPEQDAVVILKQEEGLTYEETAEYMNSQKELAGEFTRGSVGKRVAKLIQDGQLLHSQVVWTPELLETLIEKYEEGLPYDDIAEYLDALAEVKQKVTKDAVSRRLDRLRNDGVIKRRNKDILKCTKDMKEQILQEQKTGKVYEKIAADLNQNPEFRDLLTTTMIKEIMSEFYKDGRAKRRRSERSDTMTWTSETAQMVADLIKKNPAYTLNQLALELARREPFNHRQLLSVGQVTSGKQLARDMGLITLREQIKPITTTEAIALDLLQNYYDQIHALRERSFKKKHMRIMIYVAQVAKTKVSRKYGVQPSEWFGKMQRRSDDFIRKLYPGYFNEKRRLEIDNILKAIMVKMVERSAKCTRCNQFGLRCAGGSGVCAGCEVAHASGKAQTKTTERITYECSYRESSNVQLVYPITTPEPPPVRKQLDCHHCFKHGLKCDRGKPCNHCESTRDEFLISQCDPEPSHGGYRRFRATTGPKRGYKQDQARRVAEKYISEEAELSENDENDESDVSDDDSDDESLLSDIDYDELDLTDDESLPSASDHEQLDTMDEEE